MTTLQLPAFTELDKIRAAASVAARTYPRELGSLAPHTQSISIGRAINSIIEGRWGLEDTPEYVLHCATAAACGRKDLTERTLLLPWGAMATRDLIAGTASAGGNLVGAMVLGARDVLRSFSTVVGMGCTIQENAVQDQTIPNLSTAVSGNWLANEASSITNTDPVVGATFSTPKTYGALIKASLLLKRQAQSFEAFVNQHMRAVAGLALDVAVLDGLGSAGQPSGLSRIAGTGTSSGAVTAANMFDAIETVANAKADDTKLQFLTTPSVRRLLQMREKISTSGKMLWEGSQLLDRPAFVSTNVPASTIFLGDWSQCLVTFFGPGLEITVDPFTNFATGGVQIRILMHCDVSFVKPAAFLRHTSAS
jgi:HK97 family phage major capsid protein